MPSLIIDGNNISYSSFYKAKKASLTLAAVVDNLLQKFHAYFKQYEGHSIYIVWDGEHGSQWRKSIYPGYKKNRVRDPHHDLFIQSIVTLREIFNHYPIYQFSETSSEADDLIYVVAGLVEKPAIILSSDQDMIQVAQRHHAMLINPAGEAFFPAFSWVRYRIIMGDRTDNIHPIRGLIPFVFEIIDDRMAVPEEFLKEYRLNKQLIDFEEFPLLAENTKYVEQELSKTLNNNTDTVFSLISELKLVKAVKFWKNYKNIIDGIA